MVVETFSLPILIGGALVDSIAPCVIGVLILLMTVLSRLKDRSKLLSSGIAYIGGVYVTYLLGGVALLKLFELSRESVFFASQLYVAMGGAIMFFGLLEIKDVFWYGRGFSLSIPARFISFIETYVKKAAGSKFASFSFGVATTLVELPCTGAPYLAVLSLMSFIPFVSAVPYLFLYNLIFVLPLIAVIYIVYTGTATKRLEEWRSAHKKKFRLSIGLFLIGLGAVLVWVINPTLTYYFVAAATAIVIAMALIWRFKRVSEVPVD